MLLIICFLRLVVFLLPTGSLAYPTEEQVERSTASLDAAVQGRSIGGSSHVETHLSKEGRSIAGAEEAAAGLQGERSTAKLHYVRQAQNLTATPTLTADMTSTDVYPFDVTIVVPNTGGSVWFEVEGELHKNLDTHVKVFFHLFFDYEIGDYDGNLKDGVDAKVNLGVANADLRLFLDTDGSRDYAAIELKGQVRVLGKGWVKFDFKKRLFRVNVIESIIDGLGAANGTVTSNAPPSGSSPGSPTTKNIPTSETRPSDGVKPTAHSTEGMNAPGNFATS